jgi:hypothetical protein
MLCNIAPVRTYTFATRCVVGVPQVVGTDRGLQSCWGHLFDDASPNVRGCLPRNSPEIAGKNYTPPVVMRLQWASPSPLLFRSSRPPLVLPLSSSPPPFSFLPHPFRRISYTPAFCCLIFSLLFTSVLLTPLASHPLFSHPCCHPLVSTQNVSEDCAVVTHSSPQKNIRRTWAGHM